MTSWFDDLIWEYPIMVLLIGWLLNKRSQRIGQRNVFDTLNALKITVSHTIFLMISIVSFLLVNQILSCWYVTFSVFETGLSEKVASIIGCLRLFILAIVVIAARGIIGYIRHGLKYFSIIIHGTGLICTLLFYIHILHSNQRIEAYSTCITRCQSIYIQSLALSVLVIGYCEWTRKEESIKERKI